MNATVAELMSKAVVTAQPHQSTEHVRQILEKNGISSVPVVDTDGHPVVVTHEKKVVGMLSAFDLLELVEGHRYVAKNPPTPSRRKGSKRH